MNRNILVLTEDLSNGLQNVFEHAGIGVGDEVTVHNPWIAPSEKGKEKETRPLRMRERTIFEVRGLLTGGK